MKRRETIKILGILPFIPLVDLPLTDVKGKSKDKRSAIIESYNLVVYGGTPGGIACAVRAAREGLKVLLVNYNQHLGGQFANGLGTMDTLYNGARAPVYDELRYNIYGFYRSTYGYQSSQYEATKPGYPKTRFESHVVERLIDEMIERESSNWYPAIQYLGTKGFFGTYMALPNEKLTVVLADEWLSHIKQWIHLRSIKKEDIKKIVKAEESKGDIFVNAKDFASGLSESVGNPQMVSDLSKKLKIHNNSFITRGDACQTFRSGLILQ